MSEKNTSEKRSNPDRRTASRDKPSDRRGDVKSLTVGLLLKKSHEHLLGDPKPIDRHGSVVSDPNTRPSKFAQLYATGPQADERRKCYRGIYSTCREKDAPDDPYENRKSDSF